MSDFLVQKLVKARKKFGRNPKSDRDWKDRKKIEMSRNVSNYLELSRNVSKCLEMSRNVQIKKGLKSPNRNWEK